MCNQKRSLAQVFGEALSHNFEQMLDELSQPHSKGRVQWLSGLRCCLREKIHGKLKKIPGSTPGPGKLKKYSTSLKRSFL